jgi:hypothetical protein
MGREDVIVILKDAEVPRDVQLAGVPGLYQRYVSSHDAFCLNREVRKVSADLILHFILSSAGRCGRLLRSMLALLLFLLSVVLEQRVIVVGR